MYHLGSLLRERRERQLFRRGTRLRVAFRPLAGSFATAAAIACFVGSGLTDSLPLAIVTLLFGFAILFVSTLIL